MTSRSARTARATGQAGRGVRCDVAVVHACRPLRQNRRSMRQGLKVLFVTGYAENAAVGNGHLEPGMALITKPFNMTDLATKISDLMESSRRSRFSP